MGIIEEQITGTLDHLADTEQMEVASHDADPDVVEALQNSLRTAKTALEEAQAYAAELGC